MKLNDDVEIRIYDTTADVGIGYDSPLIVERFAFVHVARLACIR
ncbi:MAG: hypothetical protein WBY71_06490 [Nitrososphaeraceae archaeon]